MSPDKRVFMVAAVADNGVIGRGGEIPWHIPEDIRHFRRTTKGHTVVMGRVTFEGIGHPLPHRTNIVVTRQAAWAAEGTFVAHSVREALAMAEDFPGDIMVIGGAQVYAAAMDRADVQVLTEVHQRPAGDTYYPEFSPDEWVETRREAHDGYDLVWLARRRVPGGALHR